MKKNLILVCIFVLSFAFVSCGSSSGGGGNYDIYMVQINFPGQEIVPAGTGTIFSVTLRKNGKEVDSSDVTVSTFKDSGIGQLRIWNSGGSIDIQSDKITKKYGEITDCLFGAVSGTGKFGFTATYKGVTATVTFKTN